MGHLLLKKMLSAHPKCFVKDFLKMSISSVSLNFFHMASYIDIMLYFIE